MENHDGRVRRLAGFRPEIFGVDARTADAGKVHVETIGKRGGEFSRDKFNLRVELFHLGETFVPERIEIGGTRIATRVSAEFG